MLRPRHTVPSAPLARVGAASRAVVVDPALPGENYLEKTVWIAGIAAVGYVLFRYVLPGVFNTASHTRAAVSHYRAAKHAAAPSHHPAHTLATGHAP